MKVSRFRKFVSILRWLLLIPFRYFIEIEHIKGTKGLISSDGVLLSSYKSVESSYTMAKLNWVNSEGNFIKHRMGLLSLKYSYIGRRITWYSYNGRTYFRFSKAGQWKNLWYEIQLGTSNKKYIYKLTIYRKVKVFE